MAIYDVQLKPEKYYHIYNRGINSSNLFYEERHYAYFLKKYAQYLHESLETYAYCLLKNHFHLLVKVRGVKGEGNLTGLKDLSGLGLNNKKGLHSPDNFISKKFSDLFNAYTKSINKAQGRTGGLFETPFKRIKVSDETYFKYVVWYIHFNPQKHGFVKDFRDYKHSSYHSHLLNQVSKLSKEEVLQKFGNASDYVKYHQGVYSENLCSDLMMELDID